MFIDQLLAPLLICIRESHFARVDHEIAISIRLSAQLHRLRNASSTIQRKARTDSIDLHKLPFAIKIQLDLIIASRYVRNVALDNIFVVA